MKGHCAFLIPSVRDLTQPMHIDGLGYLFLNNEKIPILLVVSFIIIIIMPFKILICILEYDYANIL